MRASTRLQARDGTTGDRNGARDGKIARERAWLRAVRRAAMLVAMHRDAHSFPDPPAALAGCRLVSLRPVGGHAALRRAAAAFGAGTIALSAFRLAERDDPRTRASLREASAAAHVVATSPAAVRAAHTLQRLRPRRGQHWYAVGSGTAAALRRAGVDGVVVPARMDSDGLLALPGLRAVRGAHVGVLTAPGGRDRIVPALRGRGARVTRADVYARVPIAPSARAIAALRANAAPLWIALSSAEAFDHVLAALPADVVAILRGARISAASPRLADVARTRGWARIVVADDATPRSLVTAAARASSCVVR